MTHQSSSIVEFITARLDEDEATARAAFEEGTRWAQGTSDSDHGVAVVWQTGGLDKPDRCSEHDAGVLNMCDDAIVAVCDDFHGMAPVTNGAHIARQDPHRTLRKVESLRKLLAAHVGYYGAGDDENWPIETLSILAAIWNDHEDYAAAVGTVTT
ncbi:DUF6221 family protein [Streptosporangium sp. NPDC050855]|uniref:DUF6221 family protein n=1 Tax=Streptosporangium sp. NPDC050855 TaxID=3366194 RepID=UPI003795E648